MSYKHSQDARWALRNYRGGTSFSPIGLLGYCMRDVEMTVRFHRTLDFATVNAQRHSMSPAHFTGADLELLYDALTGFFAC